MNEANTDWIANGVAARLLEVTRAEPERLILAKEAAKIMGCPPGLVSKKIKGAVANRAVFVRSYGRGLPMLIRGTPFPANFVPPAPPEPPRKASQTWKEGGAQASPRWLTDPDDPRIGKVVPGWRPPVMRHVRGGA